MLLNATAVQATLTGVLKSWDSSLSVEGDLDACVWRVLRRGERLAEVSFSATPVGNYWQVALAGGSGAAGLRRPRSHRSITVVLRSLRDFLVPERGAARAWFVRHEPSRGESAEPGPPA